MKLKGINPLEQHVEKIVLVAATAVFLGVLAFQFLVQPNQVEVVAGQRVPPQRAFDPVEDLAEEVDAGVNAVGVELTPPEPIDLPSRFAQRLETSAVDQLSIRPLGIAHTFEGSKVGPAIAIGGRLQIADAKPPAPLDPILNVHRATFDPYFVARNEEFGPLMPDTQPFDKATVTVQASFSGEDFARRLSADPDGEEGPIRPVPAQWWRGNIAVVRVELERQQRTVDGSWTPAQAVPLPPDTPDVVDDMLASARSLLDISNAVDEARALGPQIQRPGFYPIIAGDEWVTPVEAAEAEERLEAEVEANRAWDDYTKAVAQRDQLEENLETAEAEADRRRLERRLERAVEGVEEAEQKLASFGIDPEVGPELAATHDPDRFEPDTDLMSDPDRQVWAHDLTAAPGETYRYRIRLHVNNPAFSRGEALVEEQAELAKAPTLAGEWSEWSAPVEVEGDTQFFLTAANPGRGVTRQAGATVEVFQFYYGYWRRGTSRLDPGDVVQAKLNLPDPKLIPLYDLSDVEAEQAEAPARAPGREREPGVAPSGRMPTQPDPGGGNIVRTPSTPERERPRTPTAARPDAESVELPEGAEPGPESLVAVLDSFLIDITEGAPLAGSAAASEGGLPGRGPESTAYFSDDSGRIRPLSSEQRARGPLYDRLKQSAELGARQGLARADDDRLTPAEILRQRQLERAREREQQPERGRGKAPSGGGGGG